MRELANQTVETAHQLIAIARKVLELESEAISAARNRLGDEFLRAVELIDNCRGKIIVTGIGKSGIAAKKIAATFASTGAPALFLHSGEAEHGDLGVVAVNDVVIALSYSGETRELVELVPRFKLIGVPVIAFTGSMESTLAARADCVINVAVQSHPWPFGLVPTASNALTVAMGDALAIALASKRGIREQDFANLHPGGLLGHKLLVEVGDIMHTGDALPKVKPEAPFREVLMEMTSKRLGVTCIVDNGDKLVGIFTDGDLRRLLESSADPLKLTAGVIAIRRPKTTFSEALAAEALRAMEQFQITSLPVVDKGGALVGLIHMHDILKLETAR